MAIRGVALTVTYTAWDTVNNTPKINDNANHTIKVIKDGTEATATNNGSIVQVGSTTSPGEYKITITSTEMTCDFITIGGTSTTTGVIIIPIKITTEHGVLPTIQQGNVGAVITSGTGTAQLNVASGNIVAFPTDIVSAASVSSAAVTKIQAGLGTINANIVSSAINVPANILQILNETALATQQGVLDVRLAEVDGTLTPVAHGGTLGSSVATLAIQAVNVTNPGSTDAVSIFSSSGMGLKVQGSIGIDVIASNGQGIKIIGSGSNPGALIQGGSTGDGVDIIAGTSSSSNATGIYIQGGGDGTNPGNAIFLFTQKGDAVAIQPTTGHGINVLANGTGMKALLLAGDNLTDSFSIGSSPIDIFDANGDVRATLPNVKESSGTYDIRQVITMIWEMLMSGKLSGLPTSPAVVRNFADTQNRATIHFDGSNNRTSFTVDNAP